MIFLGMILFMFVFLFSVSCKTKVNLVIKDEKTNSEMLYGLCNRQSLDENSFSVWFKEEYFSYLPKEEIIEKLTELYAGREVQIKIVFGTWCSDSRREVPRFFKIADLINIDESAIEIIAVDRQKKTDSNLLAGILIERVPTFFFYENGNEIGRIVEVPSKTLEEDMLEIIK